MTEEKERLATAGARVLIEGAASTDLWEPIHDSFAAWFSSATKPKPGCAEAPKPVTP